MKVPKAHHADIERLTELIEAGELTPTIEKTYPLDIRHPRLRATFKQDRCAASS